MTTLVRTKTISMVKGLLTSFFSGHCCTYFHRRMEGHNYSLFSLPFPYRRGNVDVHHSIWRYLNEGS